MFYAFGFERVGVVVGALYFVDPDPLPGQKGAERGVRLEVRLIEQGELKGSIYSARPIVVDRLVWRVDLLESVTGPQAAWTGLITTRPARGWEPGERHFVEELSAQPLEWVATRLSDLGTLVDEAGLAPAGVGVGDTEALRQAIPEIVDVLGRLLERVKARQLAIPPADENLASARIGWL